LQLALKNVSKTFRIPHEKISSLRGAAVSMFSKKRGYPARNATHSVADGEEFKALDACPVNFFDSFGVKNLIGDVSFEVKKGEFFACLPLRQGIIGRNGSGKSILIMAN
jgi:ABC-type polysaccharide/polyol phosphate transport system ATPase subunit